MCRHITLAGACLLALLLPGPALALTGLPSPGAVSSSTLKLPDKPGSLRGLAEDPSVGVFTGQVGYRVPIELPAGPAGFGPGLTLLYSGELGSGPLGVGWSLGSIQIRRVLRHGVPHYEESDELELVGLGEGGRLYREPRTGQWRVEGQGNTLRIDRSGDGWDLRDGSGARYLLGVSAAARLEDRGRVAAWHVERIEDVTRSQRIEFAYLRDEGQLYLRALTWGPRNPEPRFRVEVVLADRPDVATSWATGFPVRTRKRIAGIVVHAAGQVLRSCRLVYEDEPGSGVAAPRFSLSRLARIEMNGRPGGAGGMPIAMPPVSLRYVGPGEGAVVALQGVGGWRLEQRGVSVADVDGDGMADLLRMELGEHTWRKGRGGSFEEPRLLPGAEDVDLARARLMDLDGDARPELVRVVGESWRVSSLRGQGNDWRWEVRGTWPGTEGVPLHDPAWAFADLNGDGRTDVMQAGPGRLTVRFASDSGLGPAMARPPIAGDAAEVAPGNPYVHFTDANGDGLADAVWLTDQWAKVWLGRGDGTFTAYRTSEYPWGVGAFAATELRLADLDRDGLVDLVRLSAGHAIWVPGRADGSFDAGRMRRLERPTDAATDAVVTLADANGNGSQDLVWSAEAGMWLLDLAGTGTAGMIEAIDNGLGKTTRFLYLSSATLSVQDENAGSPWTHKLPVSIPVPVRVEQDLGLASEPVRAVSYRVRDGLWDGSERRFGGFLRASRSLPGPTVAEELHEETRFHAGLGQERVLRGKPVQVDTRSGAGTLLRSAAEDWVALPVAGLPGENPWARRAVRTRIEVAHHEGVSTPVVTRTRFSHDGEGRVVAEHHEGRLDLAGDEKEVRRSYADGDLVWLRDRICEELLLQPAESGAAPLMTLVARTRTLYTDASNQVRTEFGPMTADQATPCQGVGFGWVARTEGWLAEEGSAGGGRFVVQTRRVYDGYGNPVEVYEGGVTRALGYDGEQFRPVRESVTPAAGRSLTWTMAWDEVLGQPVRLTDPNGDTVEARYDGLGRVVSLGVNGRAPHMHYQYDWTAPRPKTATYVWDGPLGAVAGTPVAGGTLPGPAPPAGWRKTVTVANGAGEELYSATYLGAAGARGARWAPAWEPAARTWIVSGWKERDGRGRVVRVADPFYAAELPETLPAGYAAVQTLAYDALDRLTMQTLPNGGRKEFRYRAFEQTVTSSELAPVTMRLDGLERIIETTRVIPEGAAPGSLMALAMNAPGVAGTAEGVRARYDAADRIVEMALQGGAVVHAFAYDTLGRLVRAHDPDIGERRLTYYDEGWLRTHRNGAGQEVEFGYDGAGRLLWRADGSSGQRYEYGYDARPGAGALGPAASALRGCPGEAEGRQGGRLSWVREPHGLVCVGYDELGRQDYVERVLYAGAAPDGTSARMVERSEQSASGVLLRQQYEDGFSVRPQYDRAGRLLSLSNNGTLRWKVAAHPETAGEPGVEAAVAMDAAGRVLSEVYGNGVRQEYERDVLGLPSGVSVRRPGAAGNGREETLYAVSITRNLYGAPVTVTDVDGRAGSLDHSGSFAYDAAARLLTATVGRDATGPSGYIFRYQYDGLQNLVARAAKVPAGATVDVVQGLYRHGGARPGGGSYGPRQLTEVVGAGDAVVARFAYDGAGRMVEGGGRRNGFDGFDQLLRVRGTVGAGAMGVGAAATVDVDYHYGHEGFRTIKVSRAAGAGGSVGVNEPLPLTGAAVDYWFSAGHAVRTVGGVAEVEHVLTVGERLVARVGNHWGAARVGAALVWGPEDLVLGLPPAEAAALAVVLTLMLAALLLGIDQARRRARGACTVGAAHSPTTPVAASVAIIALLGSVVSCGGGLSGGRGAWATLPVTYLHQGGAAGPVLLTDGAGRVREERRYEPYGAELDVASELGAPSSPGFLRDPQNVLNKETDRATGWSYHGARWMAPQVARWLSPDPPVKAPDGKFMGEPWALNPYTYVEGNPVVYWDPDGQDRANGASGPAAPTLEMERQQAARAAEHELRVTFEALQRGLEKGYTGKVLEVYVQLRQQGEAGTVDQVGAVLRAQGLERTLADVGPTDASAGFATLLQTAADVALSLPAGAAAARWVPAGKAGYSASAVGKGGGPRLIDALKGANPWVGRIVAGRTQSTITMYRVWGGKAGQIGEWLTPVRPMSAAQARAGLALPPENAATFVSEVLVPAGTRIQVGTAAAAFGQTGGAVQVQLLERIPASSFGPGVPLP